MPNRRQLFALPFLALPLLASGATAQPAAALAPVLVLCWQARGIRFTIDQVMARIGGRAGKAALLALAGATTSADGEEVETAVEIVWEAGAPPSPAEPLLAQDLARGLPLLLITRDGRALALLALAGDRLLVAPPSGGPSASIARDEALLIGRPVIAGA